MSNSTVADVFHSTDLPVLASALAVREVLVDRVVAARKAIDDNECVRQHR